MYCNKVERLNADNCLRYCTLCNSSLVLLYFGCCILAPFNYLNTFTLYYMIYPSFLPFCFCFWFCFSFSLHNWNSKISFILLVILVQLMNSNAFSFRSLFARGSLKPDCKLWLFFGLNFKQFSVSVNIY